MGISQVVLATGNPGKLREFEQILINREVIPQSRYGFEPAEETGLSFVENAIIKARHACLHSGLPAIADDSGLVVDALNGQPGIYSSRYAGEHATDTENMEKLLSNMQDHTNRRARFCCVLVYMEHQHDPSPVICSGIWEGQIGHAPQGDNGFGYDPVFVPEDSTESAAMLSSEEKNRYSHRGKALARLLAQLG